jgi:hypothetical protein
MIVIRHAFPGFIFPLAYAHHCTLVERLSLSIRSSSMLKSILPIVPPVVPSRNPVFAGRNAKRALARDGSQSLFLDARYNRNPFAVASDRLERKRAYQQQSTRYEKELTQSRIARLVGAAINWSPWVVFLSGSKLLERVGGGMPADAILPGFIVFSIVTNPFLPEVQEKLIKTWKQPPEHLQRKARLDTLSATATESPALTALASRLEAAGPERDRWSVFRFSRRLNYDQLAREMALALISPYQERQETLRKVLPRLRGASEARNLILPALNRLLDESADERTSLLGGHSSPSRPRAESGLVSIVEDTVQLSTQENHLLHKENDLAADRRRAQAHLHEAIPALIRYLDEPGAGRSVGV